jgi:phospholipid/cholesterol/gamma-HCH transport system substrate-binding protein
MITRHARIALAAVLSALLVAGVVVVARALVKTGRIHVTAYFDNSNGIFPGDDVVMLGVPIGRIETIEPQPSHAKITFWIDDTSKVPADAKAVILSPQLVTAREIQLTPAYTGGPQLAEGAVIPQDRTAVPMEWDDLRVQLDKLSASLQPTAPGGVSPLGALINTAADNLRGQGANIRDAIIQLSQAISTVSDHSSDTFSTVKHLAVLVRALNTSTDAMTQLNRNLAAVTALLTEDPNEVGRAVADINAATNDLGSFVADNREAIGTASDKLASISQALNASIDDIKQALHAGPTGLQNVVNIYDPAHGSITGVLAANNFSNPINLLCGAIQAASRLGGQQAAKLCVQYLAPIIKNRQYNFPPLGENLFVSAMARPNELTYSEDWLRPDYRPTPPPQAPPPQPDAAAPPPAPGAPPPVESPPATSTRVATDPNAGLTGMMVPPGGPS